MKQKYVLTAVAVVAVGAVALGTVPMWEGTNSVKQEETRTSIIEDPVNTETEGTGTPTPLPTTAPVTGISHTDSYEDLYAQVKEWQNNSSYSNVQPRIMTVEESADAAGTDSAASNSSMAATMPEEPIDQEYGFDPSSEGKDYSTTTTQEELIDEADIVKTDGSCIYAMDSKGTLRIADAASMKLLCEINGENSSDYKEMYVDGNCLQLICQQEDYITYKGSIDLPSKRQAFIIRMEVIFPLEELMEECIFLHHILRKSETAQISYSTMCQGAEKSILSMTIFTFRHRKKIFLIMAGYIW